MYKIGLKFEYLCRSKPSNKLKRNPKNGTKETMSHEFHETQNHESWQIIRFKSFETTWIDILINFGGHKKSMNECSKKKLW